MNMRELESLGVFMREFIEAAGDAAVSLTAAREYVKEEKSKLIQRIWNTLQAHQSENQRVELYIEKLQLDITALSDEYYAQLQFLKKESILYEFVFGFLAELNSLYEYLREYFKPYFNDELRVPQALKDARSSSIPKMCRKIIQVLSGRRINPRLIKIIQEYLNGACKNGSYEIKTFFQLEYLVSFATTIFNLVNEHNVDDLDIKLFNELIYLNFNCLPIIWYYIKLIQKDYDQVDSYQIEYIKTIVALRDLQQLPVKPGRGCEPSAISLKEQLSRVYEEEAACLKKLQRAQAKITYKKWSERLFSPFYFHFSFNLEQVMYFFRMLMQAGIIRSTKKVVLFDFVVKHIETDEKHSFSPHSVKNKYNNPLYANAQKVKQALLTVIRQINDQFPD